MRKIILFIILSLSIIKADAQYTYAVGLRAGQTTAIVYRQFFGPRVAIDGWLGLNDGPVVKAFYIYNSNNHDIRIGIANLAFFAGFGLYARYYSNPKPFTDIQTNSAFMFGIDAIAGAEYKLPNIPFVINVDFNPGFLIYNHSLYTHDFDIDYGLSLRYIIK